MNSCLSDIEVTYLYNKYVDVVYRVCFMYLKNEEDSKDIVQSVFIKLCTHDKSFNEEEHIKSWLILCAKNMCKNKLKYWFSSVADITKVADVGVDDKSDEILELILKLPNKYKLVLYLHYYEGYKTNEIADKLSVKESTVRSQLHRGRSLLEELILKK